MRELVKIVAGGLAGLAIGYAILLWMGGPKNDFLALWPRLPTWVRSRLSGETSRPWEGRVRARADRQETGAPPTDEAGTAFEPAPAGEPADAADAAGEAESPLTRFPRGASAASPLEVREALADLQAALEAPRSEPGTAAPPAAERLEAAAAAVERVAAALTRLPPGAERQAALEQVERLASRWLAADDGVGGLNRRALERLAEHGPDYRGIALAGQLELVERRGAWFTSYLVLAGKPKLVVLISAEPPPVRPGADVVALGALVASPRERFALYEGPPQGPAVWLGGVVPCPAQPERKQPVTGP